MATVNVATELARTGAQVLLVDFDLEAPSLMHFNLAGTSKPGKGIVDYVLEYLRTGVAPDVTSYVHASESFPDSQGQLWVMPAGEAGPDYPERLLSINWQELYSQKEGYLLIENLKAQWQETLRPDYVLIDSRTGHSEVMGICTRQLPDAVCAVFVPNPQNLEGLRQVVDGIRKQERNSEGRPIQLHFVASNIPYDDDERGTLSTALAKYRDALATKELVQIHHDRHLGLLGQAIFVLAYPAANLSKDYRLLTDRLRFDNLEDRTSALRYLCEATRRTSATEAAETEARLRLITDKHRDDPEVLVWLARVRRQLGAATQAEVLLDQSIVTGKAPGSAYIERASLLLSHQGTERFALARADYIAAIERLSGAPDYREILLAVRSLAALGDVDWQYVAGLPAINSLPVQAQLSLTKGLDTSDEEMRATRWILRHLAKSSAFSPEEAEAWRTNLALALIRLKQFEAAVEILDPSGSTAQSLVQRDAFNLAMARWGRDRNVDVELFRRVLDHHTPDSAGNSFANYFQCLSIAAFHCGRTDEAVAYRDKAFEIVKNSPALEFSSWRYLRVSPVIFVQDLMDLKDGLTAGSLSPPSVQRS